MAVLCQAPQCFQRSKRLGPSESQPHQQRMSLEGRLEVVEAKLSSLDELPAKGGERDMGTAGGGLKGQPQAFRGVLVGLAGCAMSAQVDLHWLRMPS